MVFSFVLKKLSIMKNYFLFFVITLFAASCVSTGRLKQSQVEAARLRGDSLFLSDQVSTLQKSLAERNDKISRLTNQNSQLSNQNSQLSNQNSALGQQTANQQNELTESQKALQTQQQRLQQ